MKTRLALSFLFAALCWTAQGKKDKDDEVRVDKDGPVASGHEAYYDPCACALLNFWDIKPREDATVCCQALQEICAEKNSPLHCGHVYRFCLKRRAGFSAYVLDAFVREELKQLGCDAFHPDATHEAEKCGEGYCRIGYQCDTLNVQKCFADGGMVCGEGYCNSGAECAEMSSQTCKRFKKSEMEQEKLKNYDAPECKDGVCEACKSITEFKCAFKKGMTTPCTEKGCARGRRCIDVEESVCVIRPDAVGYLNGEEEHAPEKVKKKFRRFTAIVVPFVAVSVALISIVAFVSWSTIRVRKARRELAFDYDSENETPQEGGEEANKGEKDMPVSPLKRVAEILSPRLRLSIGHSPRYEEESTPLSASHTPQRGGRLFTPRNYETLEGSASTETDDRPTAS